MDKRVVLVIGLGLVLAMIGGVWFVRSRPQPAIESPLGVADQETVKMGQLVSWDDPAGFKFAYPEEIEIDPHEEDEENYAHLELTASGYDGQIMIWVKETEYTSLDDYLDDEAEEGVQVFESQLGGQPAKKMAFSQPTKLVTATIDVDALVLIEMMPDSQGYWQSVYEEVLKSFEFVPLEGEESVPGTTGSSTAPCTTCGGGNIIEEAEEVIE